MNYSIGETPLIRLPASLKSILKTQKLSQKNPPGEFSKAGAMWGGGCENMTPPLRG